MAIEMGPIRQAATKGEGGREGLKQFGHRVSSCICITIAQKIQKSCRVAKEKMDGPFESVNTTTLKDVKPNMDNSLPGVTIRFSKGNGIIS